MHVTRTDKTGALRKPFRTAEGFLKVEGRATRVGVFRYQRADGSIVRELRPPEEVNDAESLASMAGKPITLDHPDEWVTPETVQAVGVGTIGNTITTAGGYVVITGDIHRGDAIKAIDGGKRELSNGYTCDIDPTPGVWQGERFDCVQRKIRYNHVAIVDRGRAGPDARWTTDHADQVGDEPANSSRGAAMADVTIDGVVYKDVDAGLATAISGHQAKQDAAIKTAEASIVAITAERDAAKADRLDAAQVEERVKARLDLERKAAPHMGEVKCDGLDDRGIRLAVLATLDPGADHSAREDAYLVPYVDAMLASADKRTDKLDADRIAIVAASSGTANKADDRVKASAERLAKNAARLDFYAHERAAKELKR